MKDNLFDVLKTTIDTDAVGTRRWYLNGQLHRENGPAVVYADGAALWIINGRLHRENGPAIDYADGNESWYINGVYVDKPND